MSVTIENIVTSGTFSLETIVRTGHGDNTTIAAERETLAKIAP